MHRILVFIIANFNKERGNHGYERCLKASSQRIYYRLLQQEQQHKVDICFTSNRKW